jgi:hypothetical protein
MLMRLGSLIVWCIADLNHHFDIIGAKKREKARFREMRETFSAPQAII